MMDNLERMAIKMGGVVIDCVKSVHIRSYSGRYFPAFKLNTERYGVSLRIQANAGK